jgi:ATP-dependent RNA helicase RhlE
VAQAAERQPPGKSSVPKPSAGIDCGSSRAGLVAEQRLGPRKLAPQKGSCFMSTFDDLGLTPALRRGVADLGFTEPTPIQRAALPPALAGNDVLACAMTGSGKTAAFALPLLQRLGARPASGATRALVLTPTRELASQVHEHLAAFARHTRVTSVTVFGGVSPFPQERALRRGVDVVVATPGRLLDHLGQGVGDFSALEVLVLDEADRMLDMGFLPDVKRILAKLPKQRQTMLFSATLPGPIVELSRQVLSSPVRIDVERKAAPATGVTQHVMPVPANLKPALLLALLREKKVETALVFTRTKHRANRLADFLEANGVSCDRIHGNRSQGQREAALAAFKAGRIDVLVATDIAARGIDVEALPHVVNFDVPGQPEDYIHRVGRTARASATGDALTFVSPEESRDLLDIERAVGRKLPRLQLEGFDYAARPAQRFEVPIQERIAEIRARKAEERARARAKAEAKAARQPGAPAGRGQQPARAPRPTGHAAQPSRPGQRPRSTQPARSDSNPWPGRDQARATAPHARREQGPSSTHGQGRGSHPHVGGAAATGQGGNARRPYGIRGDRRSAVKPPTGRNR